MQPKGKRSKVVSAWEDQQVLAQRYRVKECARQSGTCHLYRVQDLVRGAFSLALRPSPRTMATDGGQEWFEEHARRVLAVPPHDNVLTYHALAYEGRMPFLVADDVNGRGWDSAIYDGTLNDLRDILDVAVQAARGIAWLHEHAQIHYNVKPANVLICDSGLVKVWKYGESQAKTRAYASPEQAAGKEELTRATDLWSFAVSVLHMFVGRVTWPTGSKALGAFRRYMQTGPARPGIALMPGRVAELLARCFRLAPAQRPSSMDEVVGVLAGAYEDATREPLAPHVGQEESVQEGARGPELRSSARQEDETDFDPLLALLEDEPPSDLEDD